MSSPLARQLQHASPSPQSRQHEDSQLRAPAPQHISTVQPSAAEAASMRLVDTAGDVDDDDDDDDHNNDDDDDDDCCKR